VLKVNSSIFLFLLFFSCLFKPVSAQNQDNRIKAVFILEICKYLDWKEKDPNKEFRIGIYGDSELASELVNASKSYLIDKKNVHVVSFATQDEIAQVKVLVLGSEYNDGLSQIFSMLRGQRTVIISDRAMIRCFSMINFLPRSRTNEKFEINRHAFDAENIGFSSKLYSLGGVDIEESDLIKDALTGLASLIDEVASLKQSLIKLRREFSKKATELNLLKVNNQKLEERTSTQQRKMYNQTEELFAADEEAKLLQDTLQRKIAILNEQREAIKKQEDIILLKQRDIKKYFKILDVQKKEMLRQQRRIDQQKAVLNEQNIVIKTQKDLMKLIILFIVFVTGFAIFIYHSYRQKKKSNIQLAEKNAEIIMQKEEIEAQRDELEKTSEFLQDAYDTIEAKNLKITDSIKYAKRIQHTIMPPESYIRKILPESFVLMKPKDIVSGDFYWFEEKGDNIIFAAIDCTGHGVPGALMSMVANDLLKQAVIEQGLTQPAEILNFLNLALGNSIQRKGEDNSSLRDGMDLALCSLNLKNMSLQYSGVHNPLYLFRTVKEDNGKDGEPQLIVYKADKNPLGNYSKKAFFAYTNYDIKIQKGDTIYIFSDGYADQLGGNDNRKFMTKRFRETLQALQKMDMETQKEKLLTTFELWRGNRSQIDDVLIIGVKI
jgi:serine phosphatase RsbU (regulator of sigma subunit)